MAGGRYGVRCAGGPRGYERPALTTMPGPGLRVLGALLANVLAGSNG
ncbi:hypothetical protein KGA66_17470 [Actinocrinis puniceicyclus]|uniref:Uncharacterized protein n=1 Tax=Actinocrinis puniceicyclus TaxID=977794 RepID=A0A8J8BE53_9ACTN|nr:hypothetical protein [Actinocrinis puniceicyclus]MBS2964851.1 hypothetical protein [Actinocrinis puniceicyclus]